MAAPQGRSLDVTCGCLCHHAGSTLLRRALILGFAISTVAFVVASFMLRRYFDEMGVPRSMGRGLVVFVIALGIAYAIAFAVDRLAALFS